jgi:hypothetical protein
MKKIFNILSLLLLAQVVFAQSKPDPNAKIKAIFLYNFTKYVEWPASYKQGDFVIAVLGGTGVSDELVKMAALKKAGNQDIIITDYTNINDIGKCHMLYVDGDFCDHLPTIINKIKPFNTLLITEKSGMARKGSAINFVSVNNKQNFELSTSNAGKYGLNVSSSLSKLGILID